MKVRALLNHKKIDEVGSCTYLGSISSEDVKTRTPKAQGGTSQLKEVWKNRKISLWTKIRILEVMMMTVVKDGSDV